MCVCAFLPGCEHPWWRGRVVAVAVLKRRRRRGELKRERPRIKRNKRAKWSIKIKGAALTGVAKEVKAAAKSVINLHVKTLK